MPNGFFLYRAFARCRSIGSGVGVTPSTAREFSALKKIFAELYTEENEVLLEQTGIRQAPPLLKLSREHRWATVARTFYFQEFFFNSSRFACPLHWDVFISDTAFFVHGAWDLIS